MVKQTGLGDQLYISGFDLSGDVMSVDTISGGNSPLEVTGIDKSAFERLGGVRTGTIETTSWFNPAANQAHDFFTGVFPVFGLDEQVTYCRGTTLGNEAASLISKQANYDGTRGADGSLTFKVSSVSNGYGLEWGRQLTAGKRTDTTATSPATGVDYTTVSTAFGWQAYLHVFAFTGTSVTVTLQDSADNSAFANLTGGAFTAATGVTAQRLEGGRTATVRRYLRAITTGTFSNAVFAVAFTRNETNVAF